MPTLPPVHRHMGYSPGAAARDNDRRRGSARSRGYTAEWDKQSRIFLRHHRLCLGCQALGLVVVAELVDHVVPHKGDMTVFWDRGRWQPTCRWHHDVVKQRLELLYIKKSIGIKSLWLNSPAAIDLANTLRARR